jgi:hypothetical protein
MLFGTHQNTMHSTIKVCSDFSRAINILLKYHFLLADEQIESIKDSATSNTPVIVRKDVATQTSPAISRSSSSNMRSSFSRSLSAQQVKELESCFSKFEIRDVQVDDRVTLTKWSKKHVTRGFDKNATNIIEWKKKTMESKSSTWEVTETAKCISKYGATITVDPFQIFR